jgi:hypothetical protein
VSTSDLKLKNLLRVSVTPPPMAPLILFAAVSCLLVVAVHAVSPSSFVESRQGVLGPCDPTSLGAPCKLENVNASSRVRRVQHVERRLQLSCTLLHGADGAACTGASFRAVRAGVVLRIGPAWPLLVIGDAGIDGRVPLSDAYAGSDVIHGITSSINLQLTPGLWDFTEGRPSATSSAGAVPYDTVPPSLLAGLTSSLLSASLLSPHVAGAALGLLQPGDAAATGRGVTIGIAKVDSPVSGLWSLDLTGPFAGSSAFRQRVFRYIDVGADTALGPVLDKPRSGEDADAVIQRIRDEAADLFRGRAEGRFAAADAALLAAITADSAALLPLSCAVTANVATAECTSSAASGGGGSGSGLSGFLGPGDVLIVGASSVCVVGDDTKFDAGSLALQAPWAGETALSVTVSRIDGARALPGRATLACTPTPATANATGPAAVVGQRGRLLTTASWVGQVSPGDVILLRSVPLQAVVVVAATSAVFEAGVEVTAAGVGGCVSSGSESVAAVSLPLRSFGCIADAMAPGAEMLVVRPDRQQSGLLNSTTQLQCTMASRLLPGMHVTVGWLDGGGCNPTAQPGTCPPGFPAIRMRVLSVTPAVPGGGGSGLRVAPVAALIPSTAPFALPPGLPVFGSFLRRFPCDVVLSRDSTTLAVATGSSGGIAADCDLLAYVKQGSMVVAGVLRPMIVAGPGLPPLEPALRLLAGAGSGGAALVPDSERLLWDVQPTRCTLTFPVGILPAGGATVTLPLVVFPLRLLPFRVSAAPTVGSAAASGAAGSFSSSPSSFIVYTAGDLQPYVGASTRLQFAGWLAPKHVPVLAATADGGSDTGPSRLSLRLDPAAAKELLAPVAPAAAAGLTAPLSACPLLPVLSPYAWSGLTPGGATATALQSSETSCIAQQPLQHRWWGALYLDSRPSPLDALEAEPAPPGDETVALPCAGFVSVVQGSATVSTTADLHTSLAAGDRLHIGPVLVGERIGPYTRVPRPAAILARVHTVAAAPTQRSLRLTAPYPGATAGGLSCAVIRTRLRLPGAVFPQPAALALLRTSHDLAAAGVILGEPIEVQCDSGGSATPSLLSFIAVPPLTPSVLSLSEPFSAAAAAAAPSAGCIAYRLIGGASVGVPLPGTGDVSSGARVVSTSEDLSGSVRAGDRLRVGTVDVVAQDPISPHGFAISAPYSGSSAGGLRVFNLGRTGAQETLEELARLKLACRSIYCLAKIEDLERATPAGTLERSLNLGDLLGGASPASTASAAAAGGGSAAEVRRRLLAESAAAEADVEREWQEWFKKAQATLRAGGGGGAGSGGGLALTTADASKGAEARLAEIIQGARGTR